MDIQQLRRSKRFSLDQKREILSEHLDNGVPISIVARKKGLHPVTLYQWKRTLKKHDSEKDIDVEQLLEQIQELKNENKAVKAALAEEVLDKKACLDIIDVLKKKWIKQQLASAKRSKQKKK